jgi:hypothetical protein
MEYEELELQGRIAASSETFLHEPLMKQLVQAMPPVVGIARTIWRLPTGFAENLPQLVLRDLKVRCSGPGGLEDLAVGQQEEAILGADDFVDRLRGAVRREPFEGEKYVLPLLDRGYPLDNLDSVAGFTTQTAARARGRRPRSPPHRDGV